MKAPGVACAISVHATQREEVAKQIVANFGGGEVHIQGRDGKWRDSDMLPPSNDPNPPRDKKY